MKVEQVSTHMDTDCPGEPRPQPKPCKSAAKFTSVPTRSVRALQSSNLERLASTNYSILNETKLRKKLGDAGIPNGGSKAVMEKRHREWVLRWNANCDSSRPETKRKLLQELSAWEQAENSHGSMSSASAQLGAQIKDKDFDGAAWSTTHHDSFADLIAKARKSRQSAPKPPQQSSSPPDSTVVKPPQADITVGGELSTAMEMDEPLPVKATATVGLTSPVRHHENKCGGHMPGEEHASVDSVVSSALVRTHI